MTPRHRLSSPASWRLALVTGAVTACGPGPGAEIVRLGTDVDAESLDPRLQRNTTGFRVVNLLYDGLVELDSALRPVPSLAARWEQPEPTVWVFHLREDARFHDGEPVTADDVVYTFETILDPALRAPQRTLYTPIERVEAPDAHTVRFVLFRPYGPFLAYLDMGIVPRHLAEAGHDLGAAPVGSGPYALRTWEKGSRIRLTANATHWAGAPSVTDLDVVLIPDNTARAQAFEAGDLDLVQSPLAPQDIRRLAADARFVGREQPGIAITYLNFNTARPLLADVRVRRALAMLVDQHTIIRDIYEGTDAAANGIFPPTSWAYTDELAQPPFDPAEAGRVLAEAGWRDSDGDGRLDRDGEPLTVRLGTHGEDVNRVQTVEFLQHTFGEHGVTARVEISDWPSFSARRDAGDYDVILLGWTQILDPDRVTFEQLHSAGGLNWGRYANPALDALLERGRHGRDREDRLAPYRAAARLIADDVPYYVISHQGYQAFVSRRIGGFVPNARGMWRSLTTATLAP